MANPSVNRTAASGSPVTSNVKRHTHIPTSSPVDAENSRTAIRKQLLKTLNEKLRVGPPAALTCWGIGATAGFGYLILRLGSVPYEVVYEPVLYATVALALAMSYIPVASMSRDGINSLDGRCRWRHMDWNSISTWKVTYLYLSPTLILRNEDTTLRLPFIGWVRRDFIAHVKSHVNTPKSSEFLALYAGVKK